MFLDKKKKTLKHKIKLLYCSTFNWTVPWLSWLAVTALTAGGFILYYVPIRYLILAWGKYWALMA